MYRCSAVDIPSVRDQKWMKNRALYIILQF